MCGLFPCIPILGVFFFLKKKVSRDEGSDFYHVLLSWVLHLSVVLSLFSLKVPIYIHHVFFFIYSLRQNNWKKSKENQ